MNKTKIKDRKQSTETRQQPKVEGRGQFARHAIPVKELPPISTKGGKNNGSKEK